MITKLSRIAAALALIFFLPTPASAQMSCDRVGAKSELHYGSQVGGSSVRICGEYWLKFVPKPAPKPAGPPVVYPKSFVVRPLVPYIYRDDSRTLAIGESVTIKQTAVTHSRQNMLMGFRTEVRFRPVKVLWRLAKTNQVVGRQAEISFKTPGLHYVRAAVTYSVKYRFIGGTTWIKEPRQITVAAAPLAIRVADKPARVSGRVILVQRDCLTRARAIGC